ncbi:uncharacterized protein [Procambarus clarkii]|uniref:uncharacterized protein n=1 Tax=Procambarus clarkii TaxID=6728 RepID=UPI0037443EFD
MSHQNSEGRSFVSRQGYGTYGNRYGGLGSGAGYDNYGNINKAGYGGYGNDHGAGYSGYGISSVYNYGVFLDPYLVLGSLGAAALISLLAFKVIVSLDTPTNTTRHLGREGFRDNNDMADVTSVHTIMENAEEKYDDENPLSSTTGSTSKMSPAVEDLAQGLNSLWKENKNDSGCVRCSLFRSAKAHTLNQDDPAMDLTLASVAHLLGAERSGQLLDEVTDLILEGTPVNCERKANTCILK